MSDYRVDLKVRNNRILSRMAEFGIETPAGLARRSGVSPRVVGDVINFRVSPVKAQTDVLTWKSSVRKIADALHCDPQDLFTEEQMQMVLKTNKGALALSWAEVQFAIGCAQDSDPLKRIAHDQDRDAVHEALDSLPVMLASVMRRRFGFDGEPETLEAIGQSLGCSPTRVLYMEQKALRYLRHPSRKEALYGVLETAS